jgi:hypothetical protein
MVPWPIALLSLFYGVLGTLAAASAWQIVNGASPRPLWPQALWLAVSMGAVCGLPLLKAWGRWCALAGAVGLAATILAAAAWFIAKHAPLQGLVAGLSTVVPLTMVRYLTRPNVKAWFLGNSEFGIRNSE